MTLVSSLLMSLVLVLLSALIFFVLGWVNIRTLREFKFQALVGDVELICGGSALTAIALSLVSSIPLVDSVEEVLGYTEMATKQALYIGTIAMIMLTCSMFVVTQVSFITGMYAKCWYLAHRTFRSANQVGRYQFNTGNMINTWRIAVCLGLTEQDYTVPVLGIERRTISLEELNRVIAESSKNSDEFCLPITLNNTVYHVYCANIKTI